MNRSCPACRTAAPTPCTRRATRWCTRSTDVLARRTRALLLDRDATVKAAPDVAALVAPELGWSKTETAAQVKAFKAIAAAEERAQGAHVKEPA